MGCRVGLDLGSTAIKAALAVDGELAWAESVPTAPGQDSLAGALLRRALADNGLREGDLEAVTATGYGQRLATGAGARIDEITANARGLHRLSGGRCRTIINIGGQDLKVISLAPDGSVEDFRMNDKCAAGTGRFFEQAARILDTPLEAFGDLAQGAVERMELSSTCVVFAETEMVSLLAKGAEKRDVAAALHRSVARRVVQLMGRGRSHQGVWLDGGPAGNRALARAVEDELMAPVSVLPRPQFTVAYGAALGA
jgi:predicted CoA-substrate-specific enzyme activase